MQGEVLRESVHAGEFRVRADQLRFLLSAVLDEFRAEHRYVSIDVSTIAFETLRTVFIFVSRTVKRVRGAMCADEPFSVSNGVQERLLSCARHRRLLIRACGGKIASGIEQKSIELLEIGGGA